MTVRIRVFANPSLAKSVVETHSYRLGDDIAVKGGALEVRDRGKTIKAYGAGHWIDAEVVND